MPLLMSSLLYLFCCVAFGVMIGDTIPDQAATIQAVQNACFLLSYLLSGFVFPIENILASIRWTSCLVAARYFWEVARDAFVRGGGWSAVWHVPIGLEFHSELLLYAPDAAGSALPQKSELLMTSSAMCCTMPACLSILMKRLLIDT
jgi:ABC-2 type transport system permease protein